LSLNHAIAPPELESVLSVGELSEHRVEVELAEAPLDECLFEIAPHVLDPLLLPVCEDQHRFEKASLLQVEELLAAKPNDVCLLTLLLPSLDVGFEDNMGHLRKSDLLSQLLLLSVLIVPVFKSLPQFIGLILQPLSRRLLSPGLIEVVSETFSKLAVVTQVGR